MFAHLQTKRSTHFLNLLRRVSDVSETRDERDQAQVAQQKNLPQETKLAWMPAEVANIS